MVGSKSNFAPWKIKVRPSHSSCCDAESDAALDVRGEARIRATHPPHDWPLDSKRTRVQGDYGSVLLLRRNPINILTIRDYAAAHVLKRNNRSHPPWAAFHWPPGAPIAGGIFPQRRRHLPQGNVDKTETMPQGYPDWGQHTGNG
jgi:hypothetical protein